MRDLKVIMVKGIRLDKYLVAYHNSENKKQQVISKFVEVWGKSLAAHFLIKYDDAESLIWALDNENLQLFIDKF